MPRLRLCLRVSLDWVTARLPPKIARFGSAIPKGRYSETRINHGSGGGQLNLILVRSFGIGALRNSGLIPIEPHAVLLRPEQ